MESFFEINHNFQRFSWEHWFPIFLFTVFGIFLTLWGIKTTQEAKKWSVPFYLSLTMPATIVFWIVARLIRGDLDLTNDLPIHMCNFITFFIPLVFLKKRPKLFGIIYLWVMSGTLQALITPALEQGPPHYWYFRYWLIHCLLVVLVIYGILVLKYRPKLRDLWNALLAMNALFVFAYIVNVFLGSNYLYTMAKPEQGSMLDLFGPWPWYILVSEFMAVVFFALYLSPFLISRSKLVTAPTRT